MRLNTKKNIIFMSILLVAALLAGSAAAAGGDAGDPLISLEYLKSVFTPKAEQAAQEKLDAAGKAVYDAAEAKWRESAAPAQMLAGTARADVWTEARLKHGDLISGPTGMQIMTLAGSVSAQFPSGNVVDMTDGTELASGGELSPCHRYLVAEDTVALFTVASRTAVVEYRGDYLLTLSNATPDYNAMASALKALSLFRGTGVSYGEGFELELAPTRIQALIMLIRLLGEENEALACAAAQPFGDVAKWARPYVAYAYARGYTNGVSATQFAPDLAASADMYVEFILRALGYSDTTHTDLSDALPRARNANVITESEKTVLESNAFLRADVVYLSWYALDTPAARDMRPLHERLEELGVFDADAYRRAKASVASARL